MTPFRTIDHDEARSLIARGAVTILDVRTPAEYGQLGHIPGARLLPVDLIASAPAMLPNDGTPLLVYCEHGVRSVAASRLLATAGRDQVLNLSGGLSHWSGPREFGGGRRVRERTSDGFRRSRGVDARLLAGFERRELFLGGS